jgi:hypothetical protein
MHSMQVHASEQMVCECGKHQYSFDEFQWYDLSPDGPVARHRGQPLLCFRSPRILERIAKAAGFA